MSEAEKILRKHLKPEKITDGFRFLIWNLNKQKIIDAMEEYKKSN